MPNWCENDLTIKGNNVSEVLEFIASQNDSDEDTRVFDFDKVIPYPDNFKALDAKAAEFQKEMMAVHSDNPEFDSAQREQIRIKYGVELGSFFKDGFNSGGYEWCIENWGAKWNACRVSILERSADVAKISFDTAWSPPVKVIYALAKRFPSFCFTLDFFECGMGFQGQLYAQGEETTISYDDYDGERGG